jgi:hypothetical protein
MKKILITFGLLFFAALAFSQGWPRLYWVQVEQSDSTGSFAISNSNNDGVWNDVVRLLNGPFVVIDEDTIATRDFVRALSVVDSTRLEQDSILVYYQGGSEIGRDTINRGLTYVSHDATLTGLGTTSSTLKVDTSLISTIYDIDSTRLTQDSILVYYQAGAEVGRDTIAGTGGGGAIIAGSRYTVTEASHTKTVGQMVAPSPSGWFVSNANPTGDSIPLSMVVDVTANTFDIVVDTVTLSSFSGVTIGDYIFLNEDGTLSTSADSLNIPVARKMTASNHFAIINWRPLLTGSGGGSGSDDWGAQVVESDATLSGAGTSGDLLKVDTSEIATQYDISQTFRYTSFSDALGFASTTAESVNDVVKFRSTDGEIIMGAVDDDPTFGDYIDLNIATGSIDLAKLDSDIQDTITSKLYYVRHDGTMTGAGRPLDVLKVDTSVIASLPALIDTAAAIRADFPTGDGNGIISALPIGDVSITSIPTGNFMYWDWATSGTYYSFDDSDFEIDAPAGKEFDMQFSFPNSFSNFYLQTGDMVIDNWGDRMQFMSANSDLIMRIDTANGFRFKTSINDRFLFEGLDTLLYIDDSEIALPSLSYLDSDSVISINSANRLGKVSIADLASLGIDDTKFSIAPTNPEPEKPTRPETFDYYIDPVGGNDASAGTSRSLAFETSTPMNTLMASWSGADTVDVLLMEGTHTGALYTTSTIGTYTVFRFWTQGNVIVDRDLATTGNDSGFACGGVNNEFQVIGPITIQDIFNNGFSTFDDAKAYIWDATIINADDGLSAHSTSELNAVNVTISDCRKYGIAHVSTSTGNHWRVHVTGKNGATGGISTIKTGSFGYFYDCDFLPPAGSSCPSPESESTSGAGSSLYENCRIGSSSMTGSWTDYMKMEKATLSHCYINARYSFYLNSTLDHCYGTLTIRPRGPSTDTLTVKNSVFASAYESGRFLNMNYYSSPSDVGGVIIFQDNILTNFTTAYYALNSTAGTYVDGAYQFRNNVLYNNTTDYTNISDPGTDITGDPELYTTSPTSANYYEYTHSSTSSAVNAGWNGGDCGLGQTYDVFYTYEAKLDRSGVVKIERNNGLTTTISGGGGTTYTAEEGVKIVSDVISLDVPSLTTIGLDTSDYIVLYDTSALAHRKIKVANFQAAGANEGLRNESGTLKLGMPSDNYGNPLQLSRQINLNNSGTSHDLMVVDSNKVSGLTGSFMITDDPGDAAQTFVGKLHVKGRADDQALLTFAPTFGDGRFGNTEIAGQIEFWSNAVGFGTRKSEIRAYGIGNQSSLSFHVNNGDATPVQALDIRYDGNVGIGTADITAPSQKLDVNGAVRIRGALYDGDNSTGTTGDVLSYDGTDTYWLDLGQTIADSLALGGTHQIIDDTLTINFQNKKNIVIDWDLNSVASLTVSSVTNAVAGHSYIIHLFEVNGSNTTITWPANVYLEDNTAAGAEVYTTGQIIQIYYNEARDRYYIPAGR